ncbi:hypothetical protein DL96DRAFT_1456391 [Flagelloscypha sp. PMI_526]|nr:hypothetical protein DL96DRAFT_1456391 [Flagelloscypha sp. PMI_526]
MTTVSFDLPPLPELCGTFVPLAVKPLDQTNLKLAQFGSRFLPHSTSQIRCILPIPGTPLILIGSDDGLSVLDMYPQEWKDGEIIDVHGPNEARAKPIWIGQGVFQIDMLEQPNDKNSGIVLALVGANSTTSSPAMRTVRMYNLGSLTSLAKWTVGPYGSQPLDLSRGPANPRRSESLTVNLRSRLAGALKLGKVESISPSSLKPFSIVDTSRNSNALTQEEKSTWDIVDSLPLQWASDFVSLAAHNSRLDRVDIRCYKLWSIDRIQKLAIGTKSAIWLYESPYGERAFRFIKDYYIPFKPKMIDFFLQSVPSSSNQLCLLVIFENGAGWIRLADSAVGKFNLRYNSPITSFSKINLPIMPSNPFHDDSQNIHDLSPNVQETYIVTQGEVTHILPSPIPSTSSLPTQYKTIRWLQSPTSAMARVVRSTDVQSTTHMLQVVGLGPSGVEVQVHEVASLQWQESNSLDSYLPNPVSSPKTSSSISLQEIGGTSGFLSFGGHWDSLRLSYRLSRSDPILYEKLDSKVRSKEGMYCWVQKGAEDFRVFWLGGRRERSASNDSNFDVQI